MGIFAPALTYHELPACNAALVLRQTVTPEQASERLGLGVIPAMGRDFHDAEDAVGTPATALLSYGAWQRRYGGRADILGQTVYPERQADNDR